MSHQTGIEASKELLDALADLKETKTRLIKIGIANEELIIETSCKAKGTWEDDYNNCVTSHLELQQPCYMFFRLDSKNNLGYEWLFITWSPDDAPTRQKMVYAGTRATVKSQFGGGKIVDELYGNRMDEMDLNGYHKHLECKAAPPPLSLAEEELAEVRRNEIDTASGIDARRQTVPGLSFPITSEVINKLEQVRDGDINYVRMIINMVDEQIELESYDTIDVHSLGSQVPSDHARYHLYRFSHTYEGDHIHSIVFIYSMPGYGCPIKERMLYSTCKAPLTQYIEQQLLGCEIDKKIEIDTGAEISEEFIYDEIHPKGHIVKQAFSKPKGPAGRGPRKLIKGDNPS